jgi:hypothetical protein
LGNIADLVYGEPLVESERTGEGFPVIGSNGIVGYHDESLIDGPAIVIGRKGAAGAVTFVAGACWPIDTTFFLRFRQTFSSSRKLLAYVLRYVDLSQLTLRKAVPGLNRDEAMAVRLPEISEKLAPALLTQIEAIENSISAARSGVQEPEDIINEILCPEFGYPLQEHRERVRERHFVRTLGTLAAGFTLRGSAKFHHPDFELTDRFFAKVPHERVKAFVAVPIRLGATATKGDFIEDGAAFYVHPGATKRQEVIRTEDCHEVTQEFYDVTQRRFGLRRGDVLINRSGEALGKVAIWESDEPAVASDFTMRVRFNSRMNQRFAWFFFRSVMFQPQIERELRGSSIPNIFPPEVERMLLVTCKKSKQDALAREITAELDRRTNALASIESKRAEITKLIDDAICTS